MFCFTEVHLEISKKDDVILFQAVSFDYFDK